MSGFTSRQHSPMPESEVDMDVVVAKIISLVVLTVLTVLFGLFPCRLMQYFAKTIFKRKKILDYMLSSLKCFSGGVFLGTCFLHLIPETRTKIDQMMSQIRSHSTYPVAELLTMAGFFGVIFTEHAIRALYKKLQEMTDSDREWTESEILPTTHSTILKSDIEGEIESRSLHSIQNQDVESGSHEMNMMNESEETKEIMDMEIEPAPLQDLEVKQVVTELSRGDDSSRGHMRSVLFITALSFHGVFEGMALGLQSLESNVWVLCFAISIHRGILAFGIGLQHMRNDEKHSTMVFSVASFAILAAVGIIIGIAISTGAQLYTDVNVPNAILQSLATGTLFYIIFFDILFKEMDGNKDVKKMSCTFVGFAVMAVIFAVTRE
ncbi:zinc transporter ZIP3-like [Ylistrum balloti]|uniref:zinc transporter ZIP3-like n=1 Tax=Ylistrum balloti TaxID=509963 RepID=UPI0029058BD0|nr:zinc transporter ZIP3-like [Ylistrum balloti]